MARIPSPWFWEERAEWCVNLHGERKKLGPHPDGFPAPKKTGGDFISHPAAWACAAVFSRQRAAWAGTEAG
jgi:hypothetical protein